MCNQMRSGLFRNYYLKIVHLQIYLIYMYKQDLVLNNLQWLISHKTKPNQIIYI